MCVYARQTLCAANSNLILHDQVCFFAHDIFIPFQVWPMHVKSECGPYLKTSCNATSVAHT